MMRSAAAWVEREFGGRIRLLSPDDPRGPTIVWWEQAIYLPPRPGPLLARLKWFLQRRKVGQQTCHTYVSDFLAMASEVIEDDTFPDDEAVHAELRKRGLEPPPA